MGDNGWAAMPRQISLETIDAVAQSLQDFSAVRDEQFSVVLHGGEPLLLGPKKLKQVLQRLRTKLPEEYPIGMQTNGILLTNEILDICCKMRTTVSVSIDGPRHIHNEDRITHSGRGTFDQVVRGIDLLREHSEANFLYSGLLVVVNPTSDPKEIYDFLKTLSPPSVDFLYRDGNHSRLPSGKTSFASTEYGSWFVNLLQIYLSDSQPFRIRFLDDIIKLILGGVGTVEGIGLTDYGIMVIDTDGSIAKNDTLKSTFDGADRFTQNWSVLTHGLVNVFKSSEFDDYMKSQRPSSITCRACPELEICGGGMTLHRWREDNGLDNPSIYCADQKLLIRNVRESLATIEAMI
jgi:uncharacterized protein